jgi:RimJ/RimL family protein N-acetyltransferase
MPDWSHELEILRRDPLRNVVILKYLLANPEIAVVRQATRGNDVATLLLLPIQAVAYDRQTYPELDISATLISTSPELTDKLVHDIPQGRCTLFRLGTDADREVLAGRFTLERRNAFLSFTHTDPPWNPERDADVSADPSTAPYDLFGEQGHDAAWLAALLSAGRAVYVAVRERDTAIAACFAFEIDTGLWEIGGVYTRPTHRGRGLARRAVLAALGALGRRGLTTRYQVAEANIASINLARSLGMTQFQTLTHFTSEP